MEMKHTPGLNLESHEGLGNGLGLGLLLLAVLSKASLTLLDDLRVLLLIIGAEEVHVVVVVGSLGVGGQLSGLRAVGSVGLGGIAGEGGVLSLERGDVLVPASSVGVLLGVRGTGEGLEGHDIGLGGSIAIFQLALCHHHR